MEFPITVIDKLRLRHGAFWARWSDVRANCVILLHVARGTPISRISRSCGISRPTVYKLAVVYLATRRIEDLRARGIGKRHRASLVKLAGETGNPALLDRARRWRNQESSV